jgi:rhamnulose-1-phosphate aldolase/alcohol dehydrogenase
MSNPLLDAKELQELIERTRTLGADSSLVVFGGGNTSAKGKVTLANGEEKNVVWIKASGGDMATATEKTFTPLDLDMLNDLKKYDELTDEEMTDLVAKAILLPGAARPSIETLLHGFMPFKHIDHVHADAITALTNHKDGRQATLDALGPEWAYVDWLRSGFPLSKVVEKLGDYRGVVLAHHGVITWAETSEECLKETLEVVAKANAYLESKKSAAALSKTENAPAELDILPVLRKNFSKISHKVLHLDERFKDLVSRKDLKDVAAVGVSSADHMLRIRPFSVVIDDTTPEAIEAAFEKYASDYKAYAERNIKLLPDGFDLLDAVPRVALVPGLGAITAGETIQEAKMIAEIALHTHSVAARTIDCFGEAEPLPDAEIFRFEYWPMELYKLSLKPKPKTSSGKVYIVTGAASGIGKGIAMHLASKGASLVLADLNQEGLDEASKEIVALGGNAPVLVAGDQSSEEVVVLSAQLAVKNFGGFDGIVANAGIAVTGELADLEMSSWNKALRVNLDSAFVLTREAIRTLTKQGLGGSLVYIASKNAFAPGSGFGAYSVTKAGMIQLMRIAAIEGGKFGIRSNAVNPDAVFDNSHLWDEGIREERARAHGVLPDELESFYASRNILGRSVRTTDVAEAVDFLLQDASSRTTGTVIPVDGGVAAGFPR